MLWDKQTPQSISILLYSSNAVSIFSAILHPAFILLQVAEALICPKQYCKFCCESFTITCHCVLLLFLSLLFRSQVYSSTRRANFPPTRSRQQKHLFAQNRCCKFCCETWVQLHKQHHHHLSLCLLVIPQSLVQISQVYSSVRGANIPPTHSKKQKHLFAQNIVL